MRGFPCRYVVYDTETRPIVRPGGVRELVFRLGAGVLHETGAEGKLFSWWFDFNATYDFHSLLECMPRTDEPIHIFAHNHGFDARIVGFFTELAQGHYSLLPPPGVRRRGAFKEPLFLIEDSPFLMRLWRKDGQQLMLHDLHNWLDTSLERIADWLGEPYVELPRDDAPDSSWIERCRSDVYLTDCAVLKLFHVWRELGCKDWQPTRAAGAMSLWRQRYGKKRIKQPDDDAVLSLDRHAYYGGRNEPFQLGEIEGPVWQLDVSSMYPYVMGTNFFPCEVLEHGGSSTHPTNGVPSYPAQSTAEVWLDSPAHAWPVRTSRGTVYVTGRVRTILSGPELFEACQRGCVVRTGRWVRYRMTGLFGRWVKDLWARRLCAKQECDHVMDYMLKGLMNSLYGKFGQRATVWSWPSKDYDTDLYMQGIKVGPGPGEVHATRVIAGQFCVETRDELAKGTFVPVASFITSYARVYMDSLRAIAGPENCYYQQIDSLCVNAQGFANLDTAGCIQVGTLGKLRVEGVYEWLDIAGVNQIKRDREPIPRGLPGKSKPLGPQTWEYTKWEGAWTGICAARPSSVLLQPTSLRWRSTYHGSRVHENGRCEPWRISNWHLTPEQQREEPLVLSGQGWGEDPSALDHGAGD